MKQFFSGIAIISLVMGSSIGLWNSFAPQIYHNNALWFVLCLFIISTIAIHLFLANKNENPSKFVRQFMLTTVIKLMAYLFIIVVYLLLHDKIASTVFVMGFFAHYFLFTTYEVIMLMKKNPDKE